MNAYNEISVLKTKIKKDDKYHKNYNEMLNLVETLNERLNLAVKQGPNKAIEQHLKRGQLLVRDRIDLLLDEDSPFLELCPLAGWDQDGMTLGGSSVAGIGLVCGVECLISGNVPTLFGGSSNEVSVAKGARINTIACQNRLPLIQLIQTGGAKLEQQSKVFHPGGAHFRSLAERTKIGLPTCSIVFGSSTAGGAYSPSLTDYIIMVKNQAQVFLGGPPLVQMATGEIVDAESLGGADMHSRKSGVSDQLALDEYDAIHKAREFISRLNWEKRGKIPQGHLVPKIDEPLYDIDELLGIVSANIREPFDANEVINRIVDGSRFMAFKPLYGPNIITGWADIHGFKVGIIASNNVLFIPESNKATQFIRMCNMMNVPLIFLQNTTGFMVGKKYEEEGIIKAGTHFVNAVSNSQVPAITIMMGASYGAGNYAMCGRAYNPRFLFSWPNSKCSVMGPDQLAGVMDIILHESAARAGKKVDEKVAARTKDFLSSRVEQESDVYWTTSRLLDDGVIDPRMTRVILGFCLSVIYNEKVEGGSLGGVSRM
ncbi:acetyl-CoA carboxylase [Gigaspora margarita]|uniref:methylcrotonoyl-CoA carboxylase n=1 Tax=Gigaspora margarita TaxID=4874 RepID=A0A8H3X383_GIGMA|nr:acetyl-CoA carboxylase [Gigaspora margarita]